MLVLFLLTRITLLVSLTYVGIHGVFVVLAKGYDQYPTIAGALCIAGIAIAAIRYCDRWTAGVTIHERDV